MDNRVVKVFFGTAVGAGIGALLALQWAMFWWAGALVGGVIGYLAYDLPEFARAVRTTWKKMWAWRIPQGYWRAVGWTSAGLLSLVVTVCLGVMALLALCGSSRPSVELWAAMGGVCLAGVFCSVLMVALALFANASPVLRSEAVLDTFRFYLHQWNPVKVYLYWPVWGMVWCLKRLPRVLAAAPRVIANMAIWTAQFVVAVFRLIHSDLRLLCGVDAMLGAAIGFFAGSALVGAVAGGIIGVLNFEILSKRVLGLVKR